MAAPDTASAAPNVHTDGDHTISASPAAVASDDPAMSSRGDQRASSGAATRWPSAANTAATENSTPATSGTWAAGTRRST